MMRRSLKGVLIATLLGIPLAGCGASRPLDAHDDGTAYHRGGEIRLGAGDAYGLMLHDYYLANFDNVAEDPVEVVVETSPVAVGPAD